VAIDIARNGRTPDFAPSFETPGGYVWQAGTGVNAGNGIPACEAAAASLWRVLLSGSITP